jgi:hypothetical protein
MANQLTFDLIARDRASGPVRTLGRSFDDTRSRLDRFNRAGDKTAASSSRIGASFDRVRQRTGKLGDALGGALTFGLGAAGAGLLALAKSSVTAAGDAQQSIGAVESVFKGAAETIIDTSTEAARKYGISANSYRENATLIGALFKNQGVAVDQLAGKTDKLIGVAADLSATFGGSTTEAVEALSSAFKGEFDPLERYGISLKQSTVNAEAFRIAHVNSLSAFQNLTTAEQAAAKQQATYNLIQKQSADAQGQFGRETETFAHKVQVLNAEWQDAKVAIGDELLPALTELLGVMSDGLPPAIAGITAGLDGMDVQAGKTSHTFQTIGESFGALGTGFERIGAAWDVAAARIRLTWTRTVGHIIDAGAHLPGPLGKNFREVQQDAHNSIRQAQADFDRANTHAAQAEIEALSRRIRLLKGKTVKTGNDKAEIARSEARIRELQERINRLTGKTVYTTVIERIVQSDAGYNKGIRSGIGGHRAGGGPVAAGVPYLVGEQGQELFVPDTAGKIIDAVMTKRLTAATANARMPAMAGGGDTYVTNVTVNVTSNDGAAVVAAIRRYERRNGKGWRT